MRNYKKEPTNLFYGTFNDEDQQWKTLDEGVSTSKDIKTACHYAHVKYGLRSKTGYLYSITTEENMYALDLEKYHSNYNSDLKEINLAFAPFSAIKLIAEIRSGKMHYSPSYKKHNAAMCKKTDAFDVIYS